MQDEGQDVKRNDKTTAQYKNVQKMCLKLCKNMMKECPGVLDKNANRGKEQLVTPALMFCDRVDLAEHIAQYHRFHKDGSAHAIKGSDVTTGRLSMLIDKYQDHVGRAKSKSSKIKTPDDAMR